jgi:protein-tyrosine phosphatase
MAGLRMFEVAAPESALRRASPSPSDRGSAPAGVFVAVANIFDRLLHARRALDARARLGGGGGPQHILVVCHGNVCRSPYLQRRLQNRIPDVVVNSAGFAGADRRTTRTAILLAATRGVDLTDHRSRPVTQSQVDAADFVIVMDAQQARELAARFLIARRRILVAGDFDVDAANGRAIRDPMDGPRELFESTFERLDRCADGIVRALSRGR